MHYVLVILFVLALVFGPQLWAAYTLKRHHRLRADFPGTGGELARHLLNRFGLASVGLERTVEGQGDHYDPTSRTVRLSPQYFDGRSVTAVAVAAHEVGHAIQHGSDYAPLLWRGRLIVFAQSAEKFGSVLMFSIPLVAMMTRSPGAGVAMFILGLLTMAMGVVVHLVTLPVELDASFKRALPILMAGEYIEKKDETAARSVLRACALTYVVASLASLLNFWRWLKLWQR